MEEWETPDEPAKATIPKRRKWRKAIRGHLELAKELVDQGYIKSTTEYGHLLRSVQNPKNYDHL